jgi:acetylornithine aminotransferase
MLLEPIQGEGGVVRPPDGYLTALRTACDEHGALLMVDEIQTGLCRTGRWYAHLHEPDCRPDVLASAKALGNGVPVAACVARGAAAEVLTPGSHGTTYGGNPLACRAALTVLDRMAELDLNARAEDMGRVLGDRLRHRLQGCDRVVEIRGRGLMIGVELSDSAVDVRDHALNQRVLINVTHDRVVRLLPPLIIDAEQATRIADAVADGILGA